MGAPSGSQEVEVFMQTPPPAQQSQSASSSHNNICPGCYTPTPPPTPDSLDSGHTILSPCGCPLQNIFNVKSPPDVPDPPTPAIPCACEDCPPITTPLDNCLCKTAWDRKFNACIKNTPNFKPGGYVVIPKNYNPAPSQAAEVVDVSCDPNFPPLFPPLNMLFPGAPNTDGCPSGAPGSFSGYGRSPSAEYYQGAVENGVTFLFGPGGLPNSGDWPCNGPAYAPWRTNHFPATFTPLVPCLTTVNPCPSTVEPPTPCESCELPPEQECGSCGIIPPLGAQSQFASQCEKQYDITGTTCVKCPCCVKCSGKKSSCCKPFFTNS